MTTQFDLIINANDAQQRAEFCLLDIHGVQQAYHAANIQDISTSHQRGLFDLRNFLRFYVEPGQEAMKMAEIGVLIAEKLLGADIFKRLWQATNSRMLRIQLPNPETSMLAAALARVPWEIARPTDTGATLAERNLQLRVVHDMAEPATQPLPPTTNEPLRVLFVFAEARDSRPLAARQERRELLQLFRQKIYPKRRVVAHFLTHGVTRERLVDQIQQHGGYHIVHWSGHGQLNRLELAKPGGAKDSLSGQELLALFNDAGGLLPQLLFLSACHSGDILRVKDWGNFLAVAQGLEPERTAADKALDLAIEPGFTGVAHAMLQGGVPTVVAMRYAVGDNYARELAVAFYRALLAEPQPKPAAAALASARKHKAHAPEANRFAACDHATPLLYGAEHPCLTLAPGRSPETQSRDRRLQQIAELHITNHPHFVGRTWELAGLGAGFIGASRGTEATPVAVITGLGGMGKTALAAEVLELWATQFDWILLYQAKPNALGFEATLRDIDSRLRGELGRYYLHIQQYPADAIYREACADFSGTQRLERLSRNLLRALQDEAILLVLDNFERNLKPHPEPETDPPRWACQDPAWEACLKLLVQELPGSPSRVLLTSRHPLAVLGAAPAYRITLGPLPASEAALYLSAQPTLSCMMFSADPTEKNLAKRLLKASRFHPLLLDRLSKLAAEPDLRGQLLTALDTLEQRKDFAQLPALFTAEPGDTRELDYLADALSASLDQLIHAASPDARRLLWIVALANEPVILGLLKYVWSGESPKNVKLRHIKHALDHMPQFPSAVQAELQAINTPELHAQLAALPPEPAQPAIEPLLRHLLSVGLLSVEPAELESKNSELSCHELVRERICAWMAHPCPERGNLSEHSVRLHYADWLKYFFKAMLHQNMSAALRAGSQALIYCVQAEAWEQLSDFASLLVTSIGNPQQLAALLPHLHTAVEAVPAGRLRWVCLCYLADVRRNANQPDLSLPYYQQAAILARTTAEAGSNGAQAWYDLSTINHNWAIALVMSGKFDAARQCYRESIEAMKQARCPAVHIIGNELEIWHIDIMQHPAELVRSEIEARLAQVQQWWEQYRTGQAVPEAPNTEMLARTFIRALDVAQQADTACRDWLSALGRLDATLEVQRILCRSEEELNVTRFNRANVLLRFPDRLDEARAELETCLVLFQNNSDIRAKVQRALADLHYQQNDLPQAVAQVRRALVLKTSPDPVESFVLHANLALYLVRLDPSSNFTEASRHQLASLLYCFVAGLNHNLQTLLNQYASTFHHSQATGTAPVIPRVAELLADPAFASLAAWLSERKVDVATLQIEIDMLLEQVRQYVMQNQ